MIPQYIHNCIGYDLTWKNSIRSMLIKLKLFEGCFPHISIKITLWSCKIYPFHFVITILRNTTDEKHVCQWIWKNTNIACTFIVKYMYKSFPKLTKVCIRRVVLGSTWWLYIIAFQFVMGLNNRSHNIILYTVT